MIHRDLRFAVEICLFGNEFDDLDAIERPAVRCRTRRQFLLGFGKRDVEAFFARVNPFEKKLERECCFSRSGVTID